MKEKKKYILEMFAYPSGEGLHMGHVKVYTAGDIYARFKRLNGVEVLHPTGFDAFGLPAEQYAIKNKVNPKISTKKNCENFVRQMKELGFSYNYENYESTTDPEFYKWTQWIFKQMFKSGLVTSSYEPINWCPSCKTGLANEDLEGNLCERCGTLVEKKPLRQLVIKITKYADRLLDDLDILDEWPEWIKEAQRNWIGRSHGSEIDFQLKASGFETKFTIFTTRADTLYGCTYVVLAPEHVLVRELLEKGLIKNSLEVENYLIATQSKTDIERNAENREKTGVKLEGVTVINPVNQKEVPVYIADYVLVNYGTGAIMAVPAYDKRDYEFAKKYNIEILNVEVIDTNEERKRITDLVNGKLVTKYKLRDWVFARQRYWGEPFPIVYVVKENGETDYDQIYVVSDSELPVLLPEVENYEPTDTGESPLANIKAFVDVWGYINDDGEFVSVKNKEEASNKDVKLFRRETNTMPQWAGSSWYWLRYMDVGNDKEPFSKIMAEKWDEVDVYVGGAEHATRHLIYARFWHKFLYDLGLVKNIEPFKRFENVGLILGEGGIKMSKRLGNVINPTDIVNEYGADVVRVYTMFMGPFGQATAWDSKSLVGVKRFMDKFDKLKAKLDKNAPTQNITHQTIKKIEEDIEVFKYNTAISQMMICLNEYEKLEVINENDYINILKVFNPFAPFTTSRILGELGVELDSSINSLEDIWPKYDENYLVEDRVIIAIQINGKLRGTFEAKRDLDDEEIKNLIKNQEIYKKYVVNSQGLVIEPKKIIIIKNKLVNIVV